MQIDTTKQSGESKEAAVSKFFKSSPTSEMHKQMQDEIDKHLEKLHLEGKSYSQVESKTSICLAIAENMKQKKIGGWADLTAVYL